jgi:uncharacterized alkaline shock family protein YloU
MEEEKIPMPHQSPESDTPAVPEKETQYGTVEIADSVILDLVNVALGKIDEIVKDQKNAKKAVSMDRKGNENVVSISVSTKLLLSKSIKEVAEKIQKTIKEEVEGMTGLVKVEKIMVNVLDVELMIKEDTPLTTLNDEEPTENSGEKI